MAMKKTLRTEAEIVIAGGPASLCPKGFKYAISGTIYTVKDRFISDNTEWRRLVTDQGTVEDVTLATVMKDLRSEDTEVLEDPNKPAPPPAPAKQASSKKKATRKKKKTE